jgi:hypothetical protein
MMATKRSDEVTPNDSSAAEYVGQIGAFVLFILLVRTVSWAIAHAVEPAYERGQK